MDYKVMKRHFTAGKFWNPGEIRSAVPTEVAAQVQSGTLKVAQKPGPAAAPKKRAAASRSKAKADTGAKAKDAS